MKDLKTLLQQRFKGAKRITVLGIGSDLRGDDAAGMLIAEELDKFRKRTTLKVKVKVLFGATAPESLTGAIKKTKPTHLLIIDAADTNKAPGTVVALDAQTVGGVSFSTHSLPLKIMIDFLLKDCPCAVTVLGIQPKDLDFGSAVSVPVRKSIKEISAMLQDIMREI